MSCQLWKVKTELCIMVISMVQLPLLIICILKTFIYYLWIGQLTQAAHPTGVANQRILLLVLFSVPIVA